MGHGACPSENQLREVAKVPVGISCKSGSLWRGMAKKGKLCFWNLQLVALELNVPWGRPRNLTQADRNHRTPYMDLTGKKIPGRNQETLSVPPSPPPHLPIPPSWPPRVFHLEPG